MYRQVRLRDTDTNYQRIWWRENDNDALQIFELQTLTYGTKSAAFLAIKTLMQLSADEFDTYPQACTAIRENFYVDNLLTSVEDTETAIELRNQLITVLNKSGFNSRQWVSNEPRVLDSLSELSNDPHFLLSSSDPCSALGLVWLPIPDIVMFKSKMRSDGNTRITKRSILSEVSSLYDPLGLVAPIITKAKIMIQSLWKEKTDWDETVPMSIETEWRDYKSQMKTLNELHIPRQMIIGKDVIDIHGFADASEKAYGAVIYVRSVSEFGDVNVRLVCAKSRVAPLRELSLPRLELAAIVLLARLVVLVTEALKSTVTQVVCWSDSTIALAWVLTPPYKLKTFEANRVAEIQRLCKNVEWRHVRSQDNPADLVSRGTYPSELMNCQLWFSGPDWLQLERSNWPYFSLSGLEVKDLRTTVVLETSDYEYLNRKVTEVSSFQKMRRVTAYCLRFRKNSKLLSESKMPDIKTEKRFELLGKVKRGPLTGEEINEATTYIIRVIQGMHFADEIEALTRKRELSKTSKLVSLSPFLDEKGVIRVGGRLRHANIGFERKCPIVLPSNDHVTKAIIVYTHELGSTLALKLCTTSDSSTGSSTEEVWCVT